MKTHRFSEKPVMHLMTSVAPGIRGHHLKMAEKQAFLEEEA